MEFVLNDYSLDGQFKDIEEFINWFHIEIKGVLDHFVEKEIPLLKKSDFYSRKITQEKTLWDVLHINGDPMIYQIKKYIIQMAVTEPYWDIDSKTSMDITYICPKSEDIPNCFTEAIEREV